MEIAGRQIDWDRILSRAVRETREKMRNDEEDSFRSPSHKMDEPALCQQLETNVWRFLITAFSSGTPTELSAEKAVAEIMRRGLSKENICFRRNGFRLFLPNRCYLVSKQEKGFSSVPYVKGRTSQVYPCQVGGLEAEEFAELVFRFDALVGEIEKASKSIIEEFSLIHLNKKKEQTAMEMTRKTIDLLVDEFIKPLGLQCRYSVNEGRVELELEMRKRATLDIPLDELAEKLRDSEEILSSLQTVERKERLGLFSMRPILGGHTSI